MEHDKEEIAFECFSCLFTFSLQGCLSAITPTYFGTSRMEQDAGRPGMSATTSTRKACNVTTLHCKAYNMWTSRSATMLGDLALCCTRASRWASGNSSSLSLPHTHTFMMSSWKSSQTTMSLMMRRSFEKQQLWLQALLLQQLWLWPQQDWVVRLWLSPLQPLPGESSCLGAHPHCL